MKTVFALVVVLCFISCDDDEVESNEVGVSIVQPENQQVFPAGSDITIQAAAAPSLGPVKQMDFYINGDKRGEAFAEPYTFLFAGAAAGDYVLSAIAINDEDLEFSSMSVSIRVE